MLQEKNATGIFLSLYANSEYDKYHSIRERVRACIKGAATIKAIGGSPQEAMKYLLPTSRHKKEIAEYMRYLAMADFPCYAQTVNIISLGLLGLGSDTVDGGDNIPESLRSFFDAETLMETRILINRLQLSDGGCVTFLEPCDIEEVKSGNAPFKITVYSLDKYITSQLDKSIGSPFILMDESDYIFNYNDKKLSFVNRYRVHALDANGEYYQAALQPEQWTEFDVANPPLWDPATDPADPQYGRAYYPQYGRRLDFIPFDFCNITHHLPQYENPLLTAVADLDIEIFNADAAYRQTLWLTSQPIDVIYGDGKAHDYPYGAGAVHFLQKDWREEYLEFSGSGANAQRDALIDLHSRAQQQSVSLLVKGGNMSGEALKTIQGNQTAPLVNVVNSSGESITKMLRYAALWADIAEPNAIKYIPSEEFSKMNLSAGDILAWMDKKLQNPDIPVKMAELRRRMVESGIGDETLKSFDDFMEEVKAENEALGIAAPGGMML